MIAFEYIDARSLDQALDALGRYGEDARVIAGGTALVNLMKQRLVQPAYLVGLRRLRDLAGIRRDGDLHIGALATHRAVETSPLVRAHAPVLVEALQHVASVRIRTMATIGGALAHADPNQDPLPVLIVLDARVRLCSAAGEREVPVEAFFTGYYETVIQPGEVVTEVIVPPQPSGSGAAFLKFLPQTRDDYATVSAAARVTLDGGRIRAVRVAVGSAGETPIRLAAVEAALRDEAPAPNLFRDAAAATAQVVNPLSDFRGSAAYKRDMAVVFVRRALERAVERAQQDVS